MVALAILNLILQKTNSLSGFSSHRSQLALFMILAYELGFITWKQDAWRETAKVENNTLSLLADNIKPGGLVCASFCLRTQRREFPKTSLIRNKTITPKTM